MKEQAAFIKAGTGAETNHVGENPEEAEVLLSKRKESQQPSFLWALLRAFGPYFLIGSAFKLLQDLITFVNPQLLRYMKLYNSQIGANTTVELQLYDRERCDNDTEMCHKFCESCQKISD